MCGFVLLYCALTLYLNIEGFQLLRARMHLRSVGVESSAVIVQKGVDRWQLRARNDHFVWPLPKAFYNSAYPCGKPRWCSWWVRYRFEVAGTSYEKRLTIDCVDLPALRLGSEVPILIDRERPERSELKDYFEGSGTVLAALIFDGIPLLGVGMAVVQTRWSRSKRRRRRREQAVTRRMSA